MADDSPLNDPELDRLERQLGGVTLSPTPSQRERLLYACGQAAGRAQMLRRVRTTTAVAGVFGCVSAALCLVLLTHGGSQATALVSATAPRIEEPTISRTNVLPAEQPDRNKGEERQLTAATSFGQLLSFDRQQAAAPPHADPSAVALQPVLTAAGPLTPGDPWE